MDDLGGSPISGNHHMMTYPFVLVFLGDSPGDLFFVELQIHPIVMMIFLMPSLLGIGGREGQDLIDAMQGCHSTRQITVTLR